MNERKWYKTGFRLQLALNLVAIDVMHLKISSDVKLSALESVIFTYRRHKYKGRVRRGYKRLGFSVV